MFSKLAVVFVSALAVASQVSASQCNTGTLSCCNSVQDARSPAVAGLFGLLDVAVQDVTAEIGLGCNPINVIGAGGNSCTSQPVCCTDNNFNGLVVFACNPVNVNV